MGHQSCGSLRNAFTGFQKILTVVTTRYMRGNPKREPKPRVPITLIGRKWSKRSRERSVGTISQPELKPYRKQIAFSRAANLFQSYESQLGWWYVNAFLALKLTTVPFICGIAPHSCRIYGMHFRERGNIEDTSFEWRRLIG